MFNPNAQKEDAQRQVEKMAPLVKGTANRLFTATSRKIAKSQGLSKSDHCENIERKLGSKAAREEFKKWQPTKR